MSNEKPEWYPRAKRDEETFRRILTNAFFRKLVPKFGLSADLDTICGRLSSSENSSTTITEFAVGPEKVNGYNLRDGEAILGLKSPRQYFPGTIHLYQVSESGVDYSRSIYDAACEFDQIIPTRRPPILRLVT